MTTTTDVVDVTTIDPITRAEGTELGRVAYLRFADLVETFDSERLGPVQPIAMAGP